MVNVNMKAFIDGDVHDVSSGDSDDARNVSENPIGCSYIDPPHTHTLTQIQTTYKKAIVPQTYCIFNDCAC